MDFDTDITRRVEEHEALVWSKCVEATAEVEDNPLKAEVDKSGATPLSTLATLNFARFNRVIALGVARPVTDAEIDAVQEFYASRGQTRYAIEVTPLSQPSTLAASLQSRGLSATGNRVAKTCRPTTEPPPAPADIDVVLLTPSDRDAYNAVSLAAWKLPSFFRAWFGSTIGVEGFRHYGSYADGKLVSTVVMHIDDGVAWTGFGATMPNYQGRGFQLARQVRLINDAAALGCTVIHNEADAGATSEGSTSLRNLLRLGYTRVYDKDLYMPATSDESRS